MNRTWYAVVASTLLLALAACGRAPDVVVLAFPHGGDAGADGIRVDAAAASALQSRGIAVEHLDLDSGVQNPHEDEGTDDARAVARAARLPELLAGRHDVRGIVVGPTRAIADAVPWRTLHVRVVAMAPLVRDVACACETEAEVKARDAAVLIESADGAVWQDARGRRFVRLRDAAAQRGTPTIVNRRGFRYRVPERARPALFVDPDAIDRRGFSAATMGLVPLKARGTDIERAANDAVAMLLR